MKSLIQLAATSILLFAVSAAAQTGPLPGTDIYTYAGTGVAGYSGDGGLAVNAELNLPHGVVSDAAGNLYYADGNENVVRKIVRATNVITTVAGMGTAGYGGDGGPATEAELNNPYDVALDSAGNLYIADAWNACVRRVDAHTGIITTYAGICTVLGETGNNGPATQATVILPLGVAMDPAGNLFITDAGLSLVHEVSASTGIITIFAGKIDATQLGDGGPATEAQIQYAIGIATDPSGNVFIVDSNANRVRKVTVATGIITTVAGTGDFGYGADGILGTESELAQPNDITSDALGNIYISDSSSGRIRKVDASTGIISTVAGDEASGFSGDGGPAIDAQMEYPEGLWFDAADNLYVADSFNNRIRVVGAPPATALISTTTKLSASATTLTVEQTVTLTVTVMAASGSAPAGAVTFYAGPTAVGSGTLNAGGTATLDWTPGAVGNFAVTASYPGSSTDAPSTSAPPVNVAVAGTPIATTTGLSASASSLTAGQSLTLTATVTPASGAVPTGTVSFLNGTASLGSASLNASGVATLTFTPPAGSYYLTADYGGSSSDEASVSSSVSVSVTAASGSPYIYQYAGNGNPGSGGDGCSAANATLDPVYSLASDAAGNLYIADFEGHRIRRIDRATGIITLYAGTGTPGFSGDGGPAAGAQLDAPYGIALDSAGNLYIADSLNYRIRKVDAATGIITTVAGDGAQGFGGDGGAATSAEIGFIYGIALDAAGDLYIGDDSAFRIRKVNAATGIISTVAGNGTGGFAGDGGPALSAEFFGLLDMALDQAGNIYIADTSNFRIRKVDAATGIVTTLAGTGAQGYSGDGGPATEAELDEPEELASDAAGNITFVDTYNNRVRRVDASSGIITTVAGDGVLGFGPMDGPAIDSALYEPSAVALDAAGDIYIDVLGVTQILIVGAQPNFPPNGTATSLMASATVLPAGQPLSLTATVTASACTTPGGTVSFLNGTALLGAASLNGSGVATLDLNPAAGDYSITAGYGGSSIDAPSVSAPPVLVTVTASRISTTTLLLAPPATLTFGQALTLTASVSADRGGTPAGFVTFNNGSVLLGSGTLNANGDATLQLTPAAGSYSITARYAGSSTDAASTSAPPAPVVVKAAATTTSLNAARATVAVGQPLTLTATVTAATGPTPAGAVAFYLTGPASIPPAGATLNSSGIASVTLTAPSVGVYHVYAAYTGSSDDAPSSSSPPLTVTVTLPATKTSLAASPSPAAFGESVTLTAVVSNATSTPAGTVAFYDGTTQLGAETLADGLAAFSTSTLSAGSHDMTAVYTPTPAFSASKSPVLVEVVSIASFSISAAPGSRSVYTGEAASYTVKLTPAAGFTLPVALSCPQLPADTTCAFSPATVSGGSGSSALVIQTASPSPPATKSAYLRAGRVTALAVLLLFFIPKRLRRQARSWTAFVAFLALVAVAAAVSACSGGGSLSGGTPAGSHSILVTGAASNGVYTLSQDTTVTLQVNSLF